MSGTGGVAGALLVHAALDAMCAGFWASCGRTGLVRHRPADMLAARRGLLLGALLLTPVAAVIAGDVSRPGRVGLYSAAGRAMLAVYLPYGLIALLALAAYATLSWRRRFLAYALLLGPLTLVRPFVAIVGAGAASWTTQDATVTLLSFVAVASVLAVESIASRRWYAWGARYSSSPFA